jgi:cell fate regulator YaaT (PSP1 superfamily)
VAEMNEQNFNNLRESIIEVGLAMRRESSPNLGFVIPKRTENLEFVIQKLRETQAREDFAICITNEDDELTPMKVYKVVFDFDAKTASVKDDNNETFVCPASYFLPLTLSAEVTQILAEKSKELVAA